MSLVKVALGCVVLPLASAILTLRRARGVCLANGLFEEAQVDGKGEWSSVSGEHDSCKGKKSTATMPTSAVNGTSAGDYNGCTGGENGITVNNIMSYYVKCADGLEG